MTLIILYAKEADKFLRKNSTTIAESEIETLVAAAVRKILKKDASSIDLKKMKGKYRGSFRIRKGDLRITFTLKKGGDLEALINDIDFRGNIYK